jgi:hypothetical protein
MLVRVNAGCTRGPTQVPVSRLLLRRPLGPPLILTHSKHWRQPPVRPQPRPLAQNLLLSRHILLFIDISLSSCFEASNSAIPDRALLGFQAMQRLGCVLFVFAACAAMSANAMLLAVGDVNSTAARILYECEPVEPAVMPWGLGDLPVYGGREAHQTIGCPVKVTVKLWKYQSNVRSSCGTTGFCFNFACMCFIALFSLG